MPTSASKLLDLEVLATPDGKELPVVKPREREPHMLQTRLEDGTHWGDIDRANKPERDLVFTQSHTVAAMPPMALGAGIFDANALPTEPVQPTYIPTTRLSYRTEIDPTITVTQEIIDHTARQAAANMARTVLGTATDHDFYTVANNIQNSMTYTTTASSINWGNSITGGTTASNYIYLDGATTAGTTIQFNVGYADTTNITNGTAYNWFNNQAQESVKDQIRRFMKSNLLIKMGQDRTLQKAMSPQEEKARRTLRDLISEAEWRRYLTNGFIMVKGPSGFWYQVSARREHVKVYKDNKHVHSICIHSDDKVCMTDHVLNMKVLIELDEAAVWQGGNIHNHDQSAVKKNDPLKAILKKGLEEQAKKNEPVLISFYRKSKENPVQGLVNALGSGYLNTTTVAHHGLIMNVAAC